MAMHVMTTEDFARAGERRREASTLLNSLENTSQKLATSWAWYKLYRDNVRELERLSERELDDIVIARWNIPTIAMESASATVDAQMAKRR